VPGMTSKKKEGTGLILLSQQTKILICHGIVDKNNDDYFTAEIE
jgi:hypothetical protein